MYWIPKPYLLPIETIRLIKPQIVVLDIRTNDVVYGTEPYTITNCLFLVAETLWDELGVIDIRLCFVLPRENTATLHRETYANQAYILNAYKHEYYRQAPSIHYHITQSILVDPQPVAGKGSLLVMGWNTS